MNRVENFSKKQKLEPESPPFLPKQIIGYFAQYLDVESLVKFECASKKHANLTSFAWKRFKMISFYSQLEWFDCEGEQHKDKYSYMFTYTIIRLFNKRNCINPELIAKENVRYESLKRFKHFGAFLELFQNSINKLKIVPNPKLQARLSSIAEISLRGPQKKQYGGDIALQAFIQLINGSSPSQQIIIKAINNHALFTYHYIPATFETAIAVANRNYFIALENFLIQKNYSYQKLCSFVERHRCPPLLFAKAKAMQQEQLTTKQYLEEKDKLVSEAYQKWNCIKYFNELISIKWCLHKLNDVRSLINERLNCFNNFTERTLIIFLSCLDLSKEYKKLDYYLDKIFNSNLINKFSEPNNILTLHFCAFHRAIAQKKYSDPQTKIHFDYLQSVKYENPNFINHVVYFVSNNQEAMAVNLLRDRIQIGGWRKAFFLIIKSPLESLIKNLKPFAELFKIEELESFANELENEKNNIGAFILFNVCYQKVKNLANSELENKFKNKMQFYIDGNLIPFNLIDLSTLLNSVFA